MAPFVGRFTAPNMAHCDAGSGSHPLHQRRDHAPSSPRRPDSRIRIFSSDECNLRVARRMFFTTCSAGALVVTGFAGAVLRFFIIFNSDWIKDEPQILRYAITPNCSKGADAGHIETLPKPPFAVDFAFVASTANSKMDASASLCATVCVPNVAAEARTGGGDYSYGYNAARRMRLPTCLGKEIASQGRHRALDHLLQPPTPTHCPWRSTARRGLLQHHRN
jgi:hypothetical protein